MKRVWDKALIVYILLSVVMKVITSAALTIGNMISWLTFLLYQRQKDWISLLQCKQVISLNIINQPPIILNTDDFLLSLKGLLASEMVDQ